MTKNSKPTSLKVGTHLYKIQFVENLKNEDGEPLAGQCTNDSVIEIEALDTEVLQKSTLLHEIIHAVGYYLDDDSLLSNETRVTALANLLYDVIIQNKKVKQFLFSDHRKASKK